MQLEQRFSLAIPPEEAYALLLDLERVTPCLPGAQITERPDVQHYEADMAIRIGPIRMSYKGRIAILDVDDDARRAVLHAEARDARGRGNARADIRMTVVPAGDGSEVEVATDLELTGRVAQMGRAVVQDVANDLMEQFARNLATVAAPQAGLGSAAPAPAAPAAAFATQAALAKAAPLAEPAPVAPWRVAEPPPALPADARSPVPAAKPPNAFAVLWRILVRRLGGGRTAHGGQR